MEGYRNALLSSLGPRNEQDGTTQPQQPESFHRNSSRMDMGVTEWYHLLDTTLDRQFDLDTTTQPGNSAEQVINLGSSLPPLSVEPPADLDKATTKRTAFVRKEERPKRVSTRRMWRAALQFLFFHVPSVAVTISLLILYITKFSWNPTNEQLSGLLFAARVHESFIVASLFQILYYHIRRSLIMPPSAGKSGISFGFLASAFQLNSPFYMMSSSFWAPLINRESGSISLSSIAFGVLLMVSFVVTALAGASSSVVVLPQQGWYEFKLDDTSLGRRRQAKRQEYLNPELGASVHDVPFLGFMINSTNDLYPTVIDSTGLPAKCTEASAPFFCPAYNWVGELSSAKNWQKENSPHLTNVMNISLARKPGGSLTPKRYDAFENSRQVVTYKDLRDFALNTNSPGYALAAATSPLVTTAEILASEAMTWQDVSQTVINPPATHRPLKLAAKISTPDGKTVPIKQPRVVIQCAQEGEPPSSGKERSGIPAIPNATTNTWHFKQGFYPAMDIEVENKDVFPYSEYGEVLDPNLRFIDVERHVILPTNLSVSAAFWLMGYRWMDTSNNFTVCLVDARWMESSETWTMPLQNAVLMEHTVPVTQPLVYGGEVSPLKITLDWLNMLNAQVDREEPDKVFDDIGTENIALTPDSMAILLADALARVVLSRGSWIESTESPDGDGKDRKFQLFDGSHETSIGNVTLSGPSPPDNDYVLIGLGYYHDAYGYGFKGDGSDTITILSWTVLLLHVSMIFGHLVVVMFVNKGWSSDAWAELGELLALALKSEPPRGEDGGCLLQNTGAGVNKWKTWRLRVFVRELVDGKGPSGRVEMVLQDPATDVWDAERGRITLPDCKYG
ncbi:hypothetical protein V8F06_010342 [Rhypophila decipiens]